MDLVHELKNRLSISEVMREYVTLIPSSSGFRCLCPFHDDHHPSMMVNDKKNFSWCFVCNSGGDIFGFVQKIERCSFAEAVRILAEKAGLSNEALRLPSAKDQGEKEKLFSALEKATIFFQEALQKSPEAQNILLERALPPEIYQTFRLGFAPSSGEALFRFLQKEGFSQAEMEKAGLVTLDEGGRARDRFRDRIMFPIWNHRGRICAFGGRYIGGFESAPKYLNSPESALYKKSELLYASPSAMEALRKKNMAYVVEGYFDLLALAALGYEAVVAPCGTAFTEAHSRFLRRSVEEVIFVLDADEAGQLAARKAAALALRHGLSVGLLDLPGGKDPDEARRDDADQLSRALEHPKRGLEAFFARSFAFRDVHHLEDKKNIVEELFPLLAAVVSEIDREHFFALLSRHLEMRPEVLQKEFLRQKDRFPVFRSLALQKPKEASVLEYFLGLILAFPERFFPIAEERFLLNLLPPGEEKMLFRECWEHRGNIDNFPRELQEKAHKCALFAEEKLRNSSSELQKKELEKTLNTLIEKLISERQKMLSLSLNSENFSEALVEMNELNKIRKKIQ